MGPSSVAQCIEQPSTPLLGAGNPSAKESVHRPSKARGTQIAAKLVGSE